MIVWICVKEDMVFYIKCTRIKDFARLDSSQGHVVLGVPKACLFGLLSTKTCFFVKQSKRWAKHSYLCGFLPFNYFHFSKLRKKSTCFGKFFPPLHRTQIVATCSKTKVNTHNLYLDIITEYKFQLYKRMERNQNSPKVCKLQRHYIQPTTGVFPNPKGAKLPS